MPAPSPAALELALLRHREPERWRRKVRAALRSAGSLPTAAKALGVGRGTLQKWVADDATLATGIALRGAGRPRARRLVTLNG